MKKRNIKIEKKELHQDQDIGFVDADRTELFSMVWEITKDQYSFIKGKNAERRLQRDVVTVYRKQS